ncbi:aminotransferase class I/II-fold pyridoxal phosphate-dependent enzyme [Marinobacter sp. NFXS9]|uniref:aminotransferase class I/II-fold pyridoxal phosphate-dependent enzyme n=1 Tax=Marinobacter sp. NFXS9 TaxID=2818433 RepID=UPI0032DE8AC3
MKIKEDAVLSGYEPAKLEDWYRKNYFENDIDISGSGVEEYTFKAIQEIGNFDFNELMNERLVDGPTVGGMLVRQQIASKFGNGDPDMVLTTNGGNEALQLAVRAVVEPNDEVITLGPCYHCHDKIALSMGCVVRKWNIDIENGYELDVRQLEGLVSNKTKLLVMNFPHNPTGKCLKDDELERVVELAKRYNIYILWDAVFQRLVYDRDPLPDPISIYDKTISIGTFSKFIGAGGLRFGWLLANGEIIESCIRQKDYGNLYVSPLIEFVAHNILSNVEGFVGPRINQTARNRFIVDKWISDNKTYCNWILPDGGACGIMRINQCNDADTFCSKLLQEHGVLLVPGTCFGLQGYVRIGFGCSEDMLNSGLSRLRHFLSS